MERRSWSILRTISVFTLLAVPTCCQSGGLMVTTPRVWVAGGQEKVCIVSPHALIPEVFCTIQLQNNGNGVQKNVTISSGASICVEVPVPKNISVSSAKISVTATSLDSSSEYNFTKSADISIQKPTQMTFIETDKPIYKPGDLVRVRILTLNGPDLTILTGDIPLAYVEDPLRTRVMQWANVSTVNGLGSLEMQLSDEPRLGEWTIKATIKGQVSTQKFTVEEYVLPKFEVTIHHPSYVFSGASVINWKVCARYTYGQPVNGNVNSNICLDSEYRPGSRCHSLNTTKLEDGCAEFSVTSSVIEMTWNMWNTVAKFTAEVKERGTGVKLNSTFTAKVHQSSLQLKLIPEDSGNHHYKPGLSYYGLGQVTHPDGKPVAGKVVRIRTQAKKNGVNNGDITSFPVFDLTTDGNGKFKYFLPGTFTSQDMNSIHEHLLIEDKEFEGIGHHAARVSRTLKAWYSPSSSFLQIEPFEGIASCRSSLSLPAVFVTGNWSNSPLTFFYQLMTRGDIVHTGQVTVSPASDQNLENNGKNFLKLNITFSVTPRMSGSLKVLVFTVLADGETVADSMLITVEQCFHNQVSIGFTDQQKQPGHPTTLRLSADPHSLCSISVVDKSVQLMNKGDGSLSKAKVFDLLKQYDIPQDHYRQYFGGSFRQEDDCAKVTEELGSDDDPWMIRVRPSRPRRPRAKRMIMHPGMVQSEYVDSKKAFMDIGMIVLSDLAVVTRPCSRRHQIYYFDSYRSVLSPDDSVLARGLPGPIPMAEASMTGNHRSVIEADEVHDAIPVLHRSFFPESWLWQLASVGESGTDDINLNLPHTITEWVGNGFCTNVQSGLGVASPFSINAFQPFFLSFTLPYSMIRGERVGIPVSVFNYMDQCLKVTLHLNKSSAFELNGDSPIKELRVCGQQTETHTYYIVPRELGNINFTVKASSVAADDLETNSIEQREIMTAEDIVTRKLLVEAEGKEEEQTKSAFICAPGEGSFSIELPDGLVEDSVRSFTSVIGDVMGPTLTGLESLLALPTGCGEQNMLKFSPNIFIMQYLQKTNSLTENIRSKAIEYLQTGYQRELTYRHRDGSYSAFGESDGDGSIWLTAFVVKSFAEARPFIYIDQKDLQKSIKWITSIQLENGCFPQVGKVLHKEMKGGMAGNDDNFAALTAYVLIALMEAGLKPQDPIILRGVQCLEIQQVPVEDMYTQSLMAYAYTMWNRNETKRTEIMNVLETKAIKTDGMKHWNAPNVSSASPAATEMTSYVLLAMLHNAKEEAVSEATPIVRWLSTQRNGRGGFSSTQDTVLALQALAQFAALAHRDDLDVQVMLTGTAWSYNVSVTDENRLLLQKQEGQTLPSTLKYAVSGTGCVLVQASVKYNILNYQKEQETAFQLKVDVIRTKSKSCKERSLKICTSYNGVDNASNMAVIAVKMVSGWIPDKDSIKKLSNHVGLRLKRFDIEKSIVHLYFEQLDKLERCFSFFVHQNIIVTKTKPVLVHVYDYYKPSLSAYDDYSITTTCGTKEEIMEEGNEPLESHNMTQMRIKPKFPRIEILKDKTQGTQPLESHNITRTRVSNVKPPRIGRLKDKTPATNKPANTRCPACEWRNLTEVKRQFCKTPHAYEVVVVNRTSLNVLKEMHSNVEINKTVSYRLAAKCASKCDQLKEGAQVVFMLPKPINKRKKHVLLKVDTTVAVVERSKIELIAGAQNTTICP